MLVIDARMVGCAGIGTYIRNLVPALSKVFKTTLLVDPQNLEKWDVPGSYSVVPAYSPIYSIKEQLELPRLIPKCDIFLSPHFPVPLAPIKARHRVTTIHDVYHLDHLNEFSFKERLYAKFMYRQAAKRSNLVTVSEFSKERIKHHLNTDSKVIYNALEDTPYPVDIKRVRQKYNLPDQFILYIGNLKKHKNILGLMDAHKLMQTNIPLVIFGSHEMRNHLKLQSDDNVFIKGFADKEDMKSLYSAATVFAFPSFYEGFGFPLIEAMSMGTPVLASTAASIPEVCGEAAMLVNPNDTHAMAKALDELLNNPSLCADLRAKGFARAKCFTKQQMGEEYIALLNEFC
ncbi:MAG: D-inositol-3-phosphate glycosyltransferase [Chlamydiia bacterium]|nr:D-inositol-3-phosphate glycosyltransferase [Chlamydiia bacterium]MCH9616437.1 D-inositol-3-phosphate glycosyltransferase [Chlamydiia bacterium]MCH9629577.1 D-inositol-3-phosphate glycosyltransferase [Chlamydiia bacterium]